MNSTVLILTQSTQRCLLYVLCVVHRSWEKLPFWSQESGREKGELGRWVEEPGPNHPGHVENVLPHTGEAEARAWGCPSGRLRGHPTLSHLLFLSQALLWAPGNTHTSEQVQGLSLPKPNASSGGSSSCFSFGNHPLFTPVGLGADTIPGLQDSCGSQVWLQRTTGGKLGQCTSPVWPDSSRPGTLGALGGRCSPATGVAGLVASNTVL